MFIIIVLSAIALAFVVMVAAAVFANLSPGYLAVPFVLFGLVWAVMSGTTVEPKEIGVVKTFGKLSEDTLEPGFHAKLPWQSVVHLDGKVQVDEYRGDSCITVVFADKNTGCVSVTNRWQVNDENASQVVSNYTDDPTTDFRDAVVSTEFKSAVFDAFGAIDPADPYDTTALATEIQSAWVAAAGGLADGGRVTISYVKLGEKAQAKIERIQEQEAQTAIAEEAIKTAEKEAEANRILTESISNEPNVLVNKCLDLIASGDLKLPAGSSCWPGGSSGVVLPQAAQ